MNKAPLTTLAITSALWLSLLPATVHAQDISGLPAPSEQAQIFLNAGSLTSVEPLFISFHPQQITLEKDNIKKLNEWIAKVKKSEIPIHVYSYATPPMSRMDMSDKSAQHRAMRKAFNRALDAKNALQNGGISEKLIALHAVSPEAGNSADQLRITIRSD